MKPEIITIGRAAQRAIGLGRANNNRIGLPIQPPDRECKLPENPFKDEFDASNPSAWGKAIAKFMTGLNKWLFCLENENTEGLLGKEDYDPNMNRHKQFIARALLGRMYTLLDWIKNLYEENKKANKMSFDLAKAA